MAALRSMRVDELGKPENRAGRGWEGLCVAALVVLSFGSAHAMMVTRMSLERVTLEADRIVHATIVDVQPGRDDTGLPATWITVDAVEALKGTAAGRFVIKQFGVGGPLADGTVMRIAGLPRYTAGEEVVLFLRPNSRLGFTSPVGLDQGVYKVSEDGSASRVRSTSAEDPEMDLQKFLGRVAAIVAAGS